MCAPRAPLFDAGTRQYFIDLLTDDEIDVLINVCDRVFANITER